MTTETIEMDLLSNDEVGLEENSKKMATGLHSKVSMRLGRYLDTFADERTLGHILDSSAMFDFQDGQPKRQPDISFVPFEKIPVIPDDILYLAPNLAVEVVSKNDTAYEIAEKVKQYQAAGVKLIWIVYPFVQKVEVYLPTTGLIPQTLSGKEELDGQEAGLEGFRIAVSKIFERLNLTTK